MSYCGKKQGLCSLLWQISLDRGWQTSRWPARLKCIKLADPFNCLCWLAVWKHCLSPRGQKSSCSCELVNDSWTPAGRRAFPLALVLKSQQSLADVFSIFKCQSNGITIILLLRTFWDGAYFHMYDAIWPLNYYCTDGYCIIVNN